MSDKIDVDQLYSFVEFKKIGKKKKVGEMINIRNKLLKRRKLARDEDTKSFPIKFQQAFSLALRKLQILTTITS